MIKLKNDKKYVDIQNRWCYIADDRKRLLYRRLKLITIKDVARESGYSVATCSRILSGKDYAVNETTRKKVEKCAASMGYLPNMAARSLRTKKSSEIAVSCHLGNH